MAWLCVEKSGSEWVYSFKPKRENDHVWSWSKFSISDEIQLPKGTIKKILGYELTWDDEPVEIKE